MKIIECHQGVGDKLAKLHEVLSKYDGKLNEVAYIGDDYNDLDCIRSCGFTGCPADAEEDIKSEVDYVCRIKSGEGAIREFVKMILKDSIK